MSKVNKQQLPEILFLFPGFDNEALSTCTLTYHLGTGYILAYLKKKGIHAKQFIHRGLFGLSELTERILEQKPKIVGVTCYDKNYYFIKIILQLLKKKSPKLTIIAGGPTASFSDELIMYDSPAIDICVRGEGEYTVYDLIKRLRTSSDISDIRGITYRANNRLVRTPDRPLIKSNNQDTDLDILPSPYLENIFPADEYFGVLASRGCIFRCTYCNFSSMSKWTIRYHSVQRVIAELKVIEKAFRQGSAGKFRPAVEIFDNTFSLDITRAKHICRRIIEEKIRLPFWAETRPDRIDRELLYLMYRAGFEQVHFGLETTNPKVLYTIKKIRDDSSGTNGFAPEKRFIAKVQENVRLAKEIGLDPTVSIMMGLPGATIEDDKRTLEFVKQLNINKYYHDYLSILAGTELFNTYKQYGLNVKQAFSTLPYLTEYATDSYKLPEMKNSHNILVDGLTIEKVMRIITGEITNQWGEGCSSILLKDCSLDKKTIQWLKQSVVFSPGIAFMGNPSDEGLRHCITERIVSAGLPIMFFYLFTPQHREYENIAEFDFEKAGFRISISRDILRNRLRAFSIIGDIQNIPFADCESISSGIYEPGINKADKVIFTISTLKDIKKLAELVALPNKIVLGAKMMKFDCYILDECRWSNKECPAVKLTRAIVDNNGFIAPCLHGKPIAKIGQRHQDIIKKTRLIWEDMKRRRGCYDCPVRDSCSKCLFPYPMDEQQYCNIKRKLYPHISAAANLFLLLKIIRKIKIFDYQIRLGSNHRRIQGLFSNELTMVNIARKRYLYQNHLDSLCKAINNERR